VVPSPAATAHKIGVLLVLVAAVNWGVVVVVVVVTVIVVVAAAVIVVAAAVVTAVVVPAVVTAAVVPASASCVPCPTWAWSRVVSSLPRGISSAPGVVGGRHYGEAGLAPDGLGGWHGLGLGEGRESGGGLGGSTT
jgi:hypothetical protein